MPGRAQLYRSLGTLAQHGTASTLGCAMPYHSLGPLGMAQTLTMSGQPAPVSASQQAAPGHSPLTFVLGRAGPGRPSPIHTPNYASPWSHSPYVIQSITGDRWAGPN